MTRLIDADEMSRIFAHYGDGSHVYDAYDLDDMLAEMPTIDAVEVVRCGDCRYVETVLCPFHQGNFGYTNADYCSMGTSDANIIKGVWVKLIYDGIKKTEYRCNVCGFSQNVMSKYCPSCGAYMRGGKE